MLCGTHSEFFVPPLLSNKDDQIVATTVGLDVLLDKGNSEHGGYVLCSIHSKVACSQISFPSNSF